MSRVLVSAAALSLPDSLNLLFVLLCARLGSSEALVRESAMALVQEVRRPEEVL